MTLQKKPGLPGFFLVRSDRLPQKRPTRR